MTRTSLAIAVVLAVSVGRPCGVACGEGAKARGPGKGEQVLSGVVLSFFRDEGSPVGYYTVRVPSEYHSTTRRTVRVRVSPGERDIAPIYPASFVPSEPDTLFVGAYRGSGERSLGVEIRRPGKEPVRIDLVCVFPDAAEPVTGEIRRRFLREGAMEAARVLDEDPHQSFHQYVRTVAGKRGVESPRGARSRWQRILDREVNLYSITTGAMAIQESLQLEEMTGRGFRQGPSDWTVPIEDIRGPTVASHPFVRMIGERSPVISQIASLVPHDQYYVHFFSVGKMLDFLDFVNGWGDHLLRTYKVSGVDDHLADKITNQLALRANEIARPFYDRVVSEVAITGHDPYLIGGSDVAVIFHLRVPVVFWAQMAIYRVEFQSAFAGAREETREYREILIRALLDPTGALRSHAAELGDYAVVGNSEGAVKRIIDLYIDREGSLAGAEDYRYMRILYPEDPREEEGFIHLSDSYIRDLIGPGLRIAEARRMRCFAHLKMIENAAVLCAIERGERPESFDALVKEGYLDRDWLRCSEGGGYSLGGNGFTGVCSVHGRPGYLVPNAERMPRLVSPEEANGYRRFAGDYQNYWRTYFDPVGVRIRVGRTCRLETCILPLINNTIYDNLREYCGGAPVRVDDPVLPGGAILQVVARLNRKEPLLETIWGRTWVDFIGPDARMLVAEALGETVSLGLCDDELVFSFDALTFIGEILRWRWEPGLVALPLITALNLPMYASMEIRDGKRFQALRGALEDALVRRARSAGRGRFDLRSDFYRTEPYKGIDIAAVGIEFFAFSARFFYAQVGGHVYLASKRSIMENIIDRAAGWVPSDERGNLRIKILAGRWDRILPDLELAWAEKSRKACLSNHLRLGILAMLLGGKMEGVDDLALGMDGRTYYCPSGGRYEMADAPWRIRCSVHGSREDPRQRSRIDRAGPAGKRLSRLRDVEATLRFTPEGVVTTVEIAEKE